ncbi:MAG TPA: PAS domain-containing sensor histidine kinase [Acidobacteriaceae bacterium]|nr:PAS domain-containing sensor histidine kinase [Acidobacteriaceae bacterium]
MLPSSHAVPINVPGLQNPQQLADAFSEFISASALLETSYRDLQQEVAHLGVELAQRNAELTRSLEANSRMRAALQQMIDSMPCGVVVLNALESIVTINPEAIRLLDLRERRPRTLHALAQTSQVDFEALAATAEGTCETEISLATGSGPAWLAISRRELIPAARAEANALRSIWILRDITSTKQAEQEREAARRATTLAEISTILAHEIRNPLASLELFAGLIAQDGDANPEWVGHLQAGIRTLSGTVNNVLSMTGDLLARRRLLDLPACVKSGVEFVRPIAEQSGVSLNFESGNDAWIVEGNEDAIRQILLNLISNAIRHTKAGGRVDVSTRLEAHEGSKRSVVEVRDSGCGMPGEILDHLFEAGFSGTGETPGLGLAVCKRLMAQHRGSIRVTSRLGEGSNFQLEFPAI